MAVHSESYNENEGGRSKFSLFLMLVVVVILFFGGSMVVKDVGDQFVWVRDPSTIVQPVPLPGVPHPPDHISNHPRSAYTASLKVATWYAVMNAYFGGRPPDWCGKRADGAIVIAYYALEVVKTTGGAAYRGLALILNQGGDHMSTGLHNVSNGGAKPTSNNTAGDDFVDFDEIPCPPPNGLSPITR